MLLAEALAERADIQTRLDVLSRRAVQAARVQEGDVPDEDPSSLNAEVERLLDRLGDLVRRINRTNSATPFDGSSTISDAIADRDITRRRRDHYVELADAAAARQDRYSRSEVKFISTVDVASTRALADAAAKRHRELDTRLQQLNWSVELL